MRTSKQFASFLVGLEDKENKVYFDSGGALTIGVGHLLTLSERRSGKIIIRGVPVKYERGLTDMQCFELLDQDLRIFEDAVNELVHANLTQNQYEALVSFCFNIGIQAFKNSTLLKRLNAKRYADIPTQLRRWVMDNGKKVKGLVNRREAEVALWEKETV